MRSFGRTFLPLTVGAIVMASACGGDDSDAEQASLAEVAVETTASPETTTALAPATTSTTSAARVAAAAALVPEVLCVSRNSDLPLGGGDEVWFAVTNEGATPVALTDPAASVLEGTDPEDDPLAPIAFPAGRLSPAFSAYVEGETVSWTLTGPDGTARTATVDPTAPDCDQTLLTPTFESGREDFSITLGATLGEVDATDPEAPTAQVLLTVDGVPELSACPEGLEPQPPLVFISFEDDVVVGSSATVELALERRRVPDGEAVSAQTAASWDIVDQCALGDVTSQAWPLDDAVARPGLFGQTVCVRSVDGVVEIAPSIEGCLPPIAATGGQRIRRLP